MQHAAETLDSSGNSGAAPSGPAAPGLLLVFSGNAPALRVIALAEGEVTLGREAPAAVIDDARLSRRHAVVACGGGWSVRDLGSRNGTWCDGAPVTAAVAGPFRVLRLGDSLLVPVADVGMYRDARVTVADGVVVGTRLRRAWDDIARVARTSETLHLSGETGSGKELAARYFHAQGPCAAGPFVAVNCAGIPAGLAERLLFGTRRGAYSGADADAEGYLTAADGGTLFLDEIAELGAEVQAKLLRAIESREVTPLGAAKSRKVSLRVCSATHGDLRADVAAGRFRDDLYFRLGRPVVMLPALRERAEDLAWIVSTALGRLSPPLTPHVSFVEAALLRPWPGNLRELLTEVADAAARAVAAGSRRLEVEYLDPQAGQPLQTRAAPRGAGAAPADLSPDERARLEAALIHAGGNVSRMARELGMHRTQLRRRLQAHGLDPASYARPDD